MITTLNHSLRRQVVIGGALHVLTISPTGLKLTEKGRRKGVELAWKDLASGDAALAAALNASVRAAPRLRERAAPRRAAPPRRRRSPRDRGAARRS
ncbi:MAG TPA: hypothetical protein VFY71_13520 [Planctomycetota bacterium]|nr:hypothetical protein [Planctomycetota bacterium]